LARFSTRTVLLVLLSIIILSVALRYPLVDHERYQADSYFIHFLSSSIVEKDYASWTYHPLSYFGYFPMSYPPGIPFLLAEASDMTGLSMEATILVSGTLFGVLLALCVFLLARQFELRIEVCLIVAFLAAASPRFIDTTYWVGSARGPMAVMMVMTILVMHRAGTMKKIPLVILILSFALVSFTIHHMAVLFALFGFGYIIATIGVDRVLAKNRPRQNWMAAAYCGSITALVVLASATVYGLIGDGYETFLAESDANIAGNSFLTTLIGLTISYSVQIGVAFPLALVGILTIFRRRNVTLMNILLVATAISFIPISGKLLYVSVVLLPYMTILAGKAVTHRGSGRPARGRRMYPAALIALVVSAIILQSVSIERWDSSTYIGGDTVEVSDGVFNDAAYITASCGDEYMISNSKIASTRLAALTDVRIMMPGLYSAVIGDVTETDLRGNVTMSETTFPVNLYVWFQYEQDRIIRDAIYGLLTGGVSYIQTSGGLSLETRVYFEEHSHLYVAIDNRWPSQHTNEYGITISEFAQEVALSTPYEAQTGSSTSLSLSSYLIYCSESISLYQVQLSSL